MNQPNVHRTARRRLIKSAFIGVGSALLAKLGLYRTTIAQGQTAIANLGVPSPTYLPKGYQLQEIYTDRIDGFGEGSNQVALWYVASSYPQWYTNPLGVYVTRMPKKNLFAKTETKTGAPVTIGILSGESVQAEYHDGFWAASADGSGAIVWDNSNVHSLTFAHAGFSIGVRGARMTGVNFDELARITSSISFVGNS